MPTELAGSIRLDAVRCKRAIMLGYLTLSFLIADHFMTSGNRHKLNQLGDNGPLSSTPLTPGTRCVLAGQKEGCAREFSKWLQGHHAVCELAEEQGGTWTLTVTMSAQ